MKTAALWCANIVTPAIPPPAPPVYSQTSPPPGVAVRIGPLSEAPSAASAWASVGQVAAPAVTAAVVTVLWGGAVVGDAAVVVVADAADVGLAEGALLPDPQPVRTRPTAKAPAAKGTRLFTATTIRPCHLSDKGQPRVIPYGLGPRPPLVAVQ